MLEQILNSSLSKEIITVILAMLPVAELRLSLPIAITVFDLPWYQAFYLSIVGNMIPVPFLLLFFNGVAKLVQKFGWGRRFIDWLMRRTGKHVETIQKYKFAGLIVFVAIPLPFTGAWTASLVAYILGLRFLPAFVFILLGVIGAGIIVTVLTLLGWIGAGIAIAGIIIMAVVGLWRL
jgi:uncharacterized membrane protein